MKQVVLDHCVPRGIRKALTDCRVRTAYECGWNEFTNGALLKAAESHGYNVLVTADRNLRYQQSMTNRRIAIVELPTNSFPELRRHFDEIVDAVHKVQAGEYLEVSWPE